jgi:hypothetical protein
MKSSSRHIKIQNATTNVKYLALPDLRVSDLLEFYKHLFIKCIDSPHEAPTI